MSRFNNREFYALSFSVVVVLTLFFTVPGTAQDSPLTISGASTLQPVMERMAPLYQKQTGHQATVSGGGSGAGIKNTLAKQSDIGMVSRALREEEKQLLQHFIVGLDTLVFIVNAENPLEKIDKETLIRLYTGQADNWKNLCGWDMPVVLVNKEIGRSTLELFEEYTGLRHPKRDPRKEPLIAAQTLEIGANEESLTLVGGIPGAVGYVSMGTAEKFIKAGMPLRMLPLDGVMPEKRHVAAGSYPIKRELNLVFLDKSPAIATFQDLVLSSSGQQVVAESGFIPVNQ